MWRILHQAYITFWVSRKNIKLSQGWYFFKGDIISHLAAKLGVPIYIKDHYFSDENFPK
jgi:hypothetical protein